MIWKTGSGTSCPNHIHLEQIAGLMEPPKCWSLECVPLDEPSNSTLQKCVFVYVYMYIFQRYLRKKASIFPKWREVDLYCLLSYFIEGKIKIRVKCNF